MSNNQQLFQGNTAMVSKGTQGQSVTTYTTTTTQFVSSTNYNYTDGFLTSATVDTNGDRIADQTISYFNQAMQIEYDSYGDGMVDDYDAIFSANVYPNGQASELCISTPAGDMDGDGITDYWFSINTYDTYGNYTGYLLGTYYSQSGIEESERGIYINTYDENGHLISRVSDYYLDGVVDGITTFTYDNNGNLISQGYDYNADNQVDYITDYSYNTNGQKTLEYSYNAKNGKPSFIKTYSYDGNGNLTLETGDYGADDNLEYRITYIYDSNGNLLLEMYDDYADGIVDTLTTYNQTGQAIAQSYDFDGDGIPDLIRTQTYDIFGNSGSSISDYGIYGIIEDIATFIYKVFAINYDTNNDGKTDKVVSYQYNLFTTELTSKTTDKNNDGVIDEKITYTYNQGQIATENIDSNVDGIIDDVYQYYYNIDGQLTSKTFDQGNNGSIEENISYSYNNQGQLETETTDNNGDGLADFITTYSYDANGTLINSTTNAVIRTQFIVGGNDQDILSGNDGLDNIAGNNGNDELYGLGGNDTLDGGNGKDILVGGAGADILTGGNGPDTFRFVALNDSLLSSYDKITDLAINTDTIDGINAVNKNNVFHAGGVNSLSLNDIQAVLTNNKFVANGAATFTLGSAATQQTFIVLNDSIAGFSVATDAIIEITGFTGSLNNLAIV